MEKCKITGVFAANQQSGIKTASDPPTLAVGTLNFNVRAIISKMYDVVN